MCIFQKIPYLVGYQRWPYWPSLDPLRTSFLKKLLQTTSLKSAYLLSWWLGGGPTPGCWYCLMNWHNTLDNFLYFLGTPYVHRVYPCSDNALSWNMVEKNCIPGERAEVEQLVKCGQILVRYWRWMLPSVRRWLFYLDGRLPWVTNTFW